MKKQSIFIACYALILLIGGLIGYLKTGSLPSIVMSGGFTLLFIGCSILIWRENHLAYHIAVALLFFLLLFFGYRYFMTLKLMPGGMMMLVTAVLLIYVARTSPLFHKLK